MNKSLPFLLCVGLTTGACTSTGGTTAGNSGLQPPADAPAATTLAPNQAAASRSVAAVPVEVREPVAKVDPPLGELTPDQQNELSAEEDIAAALTFYESSQNLWQQGDFDEALAALDQAYELMVHVPTGEDPLVDQEKEDLRHLISRRIVEIYASRRTVVAERSSEIPIPLNDEVMSEIQSFQGRERNFFMESYERSGLYRPMILKHLEEAGMPAELSWLPLVESGFKLKALSSAQALGLWQFIASTGYRYDLRRTDWVDERMDPEKATVAALAYLRDLHGLFGDWTTALAAYNCGEGNVGRAIRRQQVSYFDRFWDLYSALPKETRRYVPRLLATLAIVADPEAYGFELPTPLPPMTWDRVEVNRSISLADLDKQLSIESGTIESLNAELRRKATPNAQYSLRVPVGAGETVLASLSSTPNWVTTDEMISHRVRSGETLSGIARKYGTTVDDLTRLNQLRSANRIKPGQLLTVRGTTRTNRDQIQPGTALAYSVQPGDSLWLIANRYRTTVDQIRADNGLQGSNLQVGQQLQIRQKSTGSSRASYVVRRGDTLSAIAEKLQVPLSNLLQANGLSSRSTIYPGQTLQSP